MEAVPAVLGPVLTKIEESLMESTKRQVRYLLCFKGIVKDLRDEHEKLRYRIEIVQNDVERAKNNAEDIENVVQKWLKDVDEVMKDVEELEKEIQANKTCLAGFCPNWGWRFGLSRKAEKKRTIMLNLRESSKFDKLSHPAPLPGIEFLAPQDFELFDSTKSTFNGIVEALRDDQINMVGLHGMGGVGKTTLAKSLGDRVQKDKIFDKVVMAIVSGNLIIESIQDQIAESLELTFTQKTELGRAKQLHLRFTKSEKKILIVLDDIWKHFDLKTKIGIPFQDGHKGCKVLLTTRFEGVCKEMGCDKTFKLNTLNEKEQWDLFKKHAGPGVEDSTLNALAIKIVNECKGLPLALVIIGSSLREKDANDYEVMYTKLQKSKLEEIQYCDRGIYACLKSSYDFLRREDEKLCFLLCSLFPEDSMIYLEQLVQYGINLGLFEDADSIERARSLLRVTVKELKASCLLSYADADVFVKMHDIVRDVALCIASKEKKFLGKAGMGLTEWPNEKNMEQLVAISLIGNDINVLPDGLKYPNLRFLLLDAKSLGLYTNVSNHFFEQMKALEVLSLSCRILSLKPLEFLTNLQNLQLECCTLNDMSSLGKLDRLEILSLKRSHFDELPEELGNLSKLRLLDLSFCYPLKWIPSNVLRRLSKLEELYMAKLGTRLIEWEVEGTTAAGSKARLSELNSLSRLAILSLDIRGNCLQKDFAFREFQRYDITVNYNHSSRIFRVPTKVLKIKDVEAPLLTTFKALYQTLEDLHLNGITDFRNILPAIDQVGLNELKTLDVDKCKELEYVIDMTRQQFPGSVFSKLENLSLKNLSSLEAICYGGNFAGGFLENLKSISLIQCIRISSLFPISIARGFLRLEELTISNAPKLKQVFCLDHGREDIVVEGHGKDVVFPKLKKLRFDELGSLTSFLPENYRSTLPALEELIICNCSSLNTAFISEVKRHFLNENLRVLEVGGYKQQLCDGIVGCLSQYEFKNLEGIIIKKCGVKVVFDLEGVNEQQRQLSLPSLKRLWLKSLQELEHLCKGPTHLLSLQNLTFLDINKCGQVRYIFTPRLAQNLSKLESLYVWDCGELEKIIVEDDEEDDDIQPHLLFPNLRKIDVWGCKKLKRVFPITIARGLQQLKELRVWENIELEQVFGERERDRDGGGKVMEMDDKAIVLPQLQWLSLGKLPSLTSFCPVGYHFIFPSFKNDGKLAIRGCDKIATIFSLDDKESIHAEAKPLNSKEGSNDEEERTMDIYCRGPNQLRAKLPPYMEQIRTEGITPGTSRRET